MSNVDWRLRIEEAPAAPNRGGPVVKGARVEVVAVLSLVADGWSVDRIVARFPGLTIEDVRACAAYAKEIVERESMRRFVQIGIDSADRGNLVDDEEVWRQFEVEFGPAGSPKDE